MADQAVAGVNNADPAVVSDFDAHSSSWNMIEASFSSAPLIIINKQQVNPAGPVAGAPGRGESFFAITKSLIIRALIIYFITSMFRRPTPPVVDPKTGGPAPAARMPSTQLYANGTIFVR